MAPDCDPRLSVLTRLQFLKRAAESHALIFAFHMDFPGLGYAYAQNEAWHWQPIQDSLK